MPFGEAAAIPQCPAPGVVRTSADRVPLYGPDSMATASMAA